MTGLTRVLLALVLVSLGASTAFADVTITIDPGSYVGRYFIDSDFNVTHTGCQLPPAAMSLLRTSGSAPGPINQDDYLQASDNGSSFRIDTANCQYIYNLGTSALGAGQYLVQISINGVVIGRTAFGLN